MPSVSAHFVCAVPLIARMKGAGTPGRGVYQNVLRGCRRQVGQMVVRGTCYYKLILKLVPCTSLLSMMYIRLVLQHDRENEN